MQYRRNYSCCGFEEQHLPFQTILNSEFVLNSMMQRNSQTTDLLLRKTVSYLKHYNFSGLLLCPIDYYIIQMYTFSSLMVVQCIGSCFAGQRFPQQAAIFEAQPYGHALHILLMQDARGFQGMKVLEGITSFFFLVKTKKKTNHLCEAQCLEANQSLEGRGINKIKKGH